MSEQPGGAYISWNEVKARLKQVADYLPKYFKNPVEGIANIPEWDWWTLLLLESLLGILLGVLAGIISGHVLAVFGGIIIGPVMNLLTTFITAGLLYYIALFFFKTEVDFKKSFTIVILAALPGQLLSTLVNLARPVGLFSIVITTFLLIIGFSTNFKLDKLKLSKILGSIAGIIALFWLISIVNEATSPHIKVQEFTPESLDQIHKELGEGN
jgi:hypothetical protein